MFLLQAKFSAVNSPAALVAVVSVLVTVAVTVVVAAVTVAAESTYPAPYHGPQSPKGVTGYDLVVLSRTLGCRSFATVAMEPVD